MLADLLINNKFEAYRLNNLCTTCRVLEVDMLIKLLIFFGMGSYRNGAAGCSLFILGA